MQIIFGDHVEKVRDRFTVLELDTVQVAGSETTMTAWCVVDKIPLEEIPLIDSLSKMHHDLIQQYKVGNWAYCRQAMAHLRGKFSGELDSFYDHLSQRIENLAADALPQGWNGVIVSAIQGSEAAVAPGDAAGV